MKRKLILGLLIAVIAGVAAGIQVYNPTNAQDPPKKVAPAEKKVEADLFEVLKKSLEGKKETPVVPAPAVLPPVKDDKVALPPPVLPSAPPPLNDVKPVSAQDIAPPALPKPVPYTADPPTVAAPPFTVKPMPVAPLPPSQVVPPFAPISKDPAPNPVVPPFAPISKAPIDDRTQPPTVQITPNKIPQQLATLKDCPWSLQVDLVEGRTVVTATVNKKHEFKIVCQSLDLQTGKSVLKALGKVQITGDMMTGSCEHLSISLHEDRLLLEGGAQVSIQKVSTNVSSEKPASFELKGETLNLRISELQSPVLQTSWRQADINRTRPEPMVTSTSKAKEWTAFGTLRPAKLDLGGKEMAWTLQGRDGKVFAHLVARDGGTLRQYESQTISVFGSTEQINGQAMLRVTHIALP